MVPRADIVAGKGYSAGRGARVRERAHSRLVCTTTRSTTPGMVHIRDLVATSTSRAVFGLRTAAKRNKLLTSPI